MRIRGFCVALSLVIGALVPVCARSAEPTYTVKLNHPEEVGHMCEVKASGTSTRTYSYRDAAGKAGSTGENVG